MIINSKTIVVGCNYHTTWQSHKAMRFVLIEVNGDKARLTSRNTKKTFWTDVKDLIFITSQHNIQKAKDKIKLRDEKAKLSNYTLG